MWVWYGSPQPLHPLPEITAADVDNDDFMHLHFAFETSTAVLRIVENFYDAQHAAPVHELPISAFELKLFDDWQRWPELEPLAQAGAWFGAGIDFTVDRYFGPFGMPVIPEVVEREQPEQLRDYFRERVIHYRMESHKFSRLPYEPKSK